MRTIWHGEGRLTHDIVELHPSVSCCQSHQEITGEQALARLRSRESGNIEVGVLSSNIP